MDLSWTYDPVALTADLALDRCGSPTLGDELVTAVILSLFSEARALLDDALPDGSIDRRGWWGDALPAVAGDRYGSRLWLLGREKQIPSVLARVEAYANEALAWLIADGIAERINVIASFPALSRLALEIEIHRPKAPPARYRFAALWPPETR